jgi:lysophospholipase L1-like esterase
MRRLVTVLISFTLALTLAGLNDAQARQVAPPQSMAAIGDSITQAYDVCCSYGSHPANSWSTGDAPGDGVTSHYERILTLNPDIAGRNYNDSVPGARMSAGPAAAFVWDVANICQSMLAPDRTEEERQLVRARNLAYNDVLEQECAAYERCRYDGDAVFDYAFGTSAVSHLDYFHPSLYGQAELARVTWAQSWWN